MNSFKKSLDIKMYQSVDKIIQARIEDELNKLEAMSDNQDYKNHIQDRKNKIVEVVFPDFDYNMNIIEERTRFKTKNITTNKDNYKSILDKIIKKRIFRQIEQLYTSMSSTKSQITGEELDKILSQILDREIRIEMLLEDLDKNMDILNNYKKRTSSPEQEPLIH